MRNSVVLIGRGPLFWEVKDFLTDHHIHVVSPDELSSLEIRAVLDVETGMDEVKKHELMQIESKIPSAVPVFTSALHRTATEIASWMKHPERVAGFSPLLLGEMNTVEISRPLQANEEHVWNQCLLFWKELGKEVEVVGDEPGLVFPRILSLLVNEAAFALSEGIASVEDIDLAMKMGTNFPSGPLEWADEIGIDQIVSILSGLHRELGDDCYRPAPLLRKMVYAGYLGQASGRGFYRYDRK